MASAGGNYENFLPQNAVLFAGQRLVDANCSYHLDMQTDSNLVIYAGEGTSNVVWANNRAGNGVPNQAYAVLQTDGNFVEYVPPAGDEYGDVNAIWASNTDNGTQDILEMQVDGNLVIYPENGIGIGSRATWASNTSRAIETAPATCIWQSSYTQLNDNTSVVAGTKIPNAAYALQTWALCGQMCVDTGGCTAWEFDGDYDWLLPGTCYLYEGNATIGAPKVPEAITGSVVSAWQTGL